MSLPVPTTELDHLDRIDLTQVAARGCHGVWEDEQTSPQDFLVDVVVWLEPEPQRPDSLDHTVSYVEVSQTIVREVAETSYRLLETLGRHLCQVLLAGQPRAYAVDVRIHKPRAAKDAGCTDLSVTVRRRRP